MRVQQSRVRRRPTITEANNSCGAQARNDQTPFGHVFSSHPLSCDHYKCGSVHNDGIPWFASYFDAQFNSSMVYSPYHTNKWLPRIHVLISDAEQVGEAIVAYYKMFLHIFNFFMNSTKSTGDRMDYGQRQAISHYGYCTFISCLRCTIFFG